MLLLFCGLLARAVELQLLKGGVLRELADKQQRRTQTTVAPRGEILDREGEELAVSLSVESVYADPLQVKEPSQAARQLSSLLEIPAGELERLLQRKGRFSWLARQIEPDVAQAIRELELDGIHFVREPKRFYPNSALMGQVLGFVGVDAVGLEGLERRYEPYLAGKEQVVELQRDARGRGIFSGKIEERLSGGSYRLQLTIDKAIAYEAQKALDKAVEKYKAKNGVAIAQDVETGAILAMVVSPSFDPNRFSEYPVGHGRNRAVADVYEPGSTMKAVLIAAALESKVLQPDTILYCENGSYQVADRRINDTKKHGWLSATQIIKYSSNIGALKIARLIGREKWFDYLVGFGFGADTGIDLPGESRGLMRPVAKWGEVLQATSSYGQGIGATPIQMVNALSAIANGGRLMRPFVARRVLDEKGNPIIETAPEVIGRPISPETAKRVWSILEAVVHDGGTGDQARIPGYRIAGKTGTAQKVDPQTGGYSREKYIASFGGFLPARDPRVAIYVSINEPIGNIYGGTVAAPVFAAIAEKAMEQLQIPADEAVLPEPLEREGKQAFTARFAAAEGIPGGQALAGMTVREVMRWGQAEGYDMIPIGTGLAHEARCVESTCEVVFRSL